MLTDLLLRQFALSSAMVIVCVVIHGIGLFSFARAIRGEASVERLQRVTALSLRGALFTLSIMLGLVALHGIEIWLFALLYLAIGAISNLAAALYFSTISYSTVGYNDLHIVAQWRLLGAFESILGIILLGWSTAFFFRMLDRIDAH